MSWRFSRALLGDMCGCVDRDGTDVSRDIFVAIDEQAGIDENHDRVKDYKAMLRENEVNFSFIKDRE